MLMALRTRTLAGCFRNVRTACSFSIRLAPDEVPDVRLPLAADWNETGSGNRNSLAEPLTMFQGRGCSRTWMRALNHVCTSDVIRTAPAARGHERARCGLVAHGAVFAPESPPIRAA